jgi:hypothetical protein
VMHEQLPVSGGAVGVGIMGVATTVMARRDASAHVEEQQLLTRLVAQHLDDSSAQDGVAQQQRKVCGCGER